MFNILRCPACCRPSRMWITFNRFSTIFKSSVTHFYLAELIATFLKAFWIIWVISVEECSSLMQNLMQIHCSTCSVILSNGHTVHMLTQWCLLPPLTSTVKSSLFMHVHSSPPSLAARLHWCCTNCSHIDNGCTTSKLKTCSSKDAINIMKMHPINWEKYLQIIYLIKWLIPRKYK